MDIIAKLAEELGIRKGQAEAAVKLIDEGNTIPIQDWLEWGEPDREVMVENRVPELVRQFISNDEASLFSVIDYCDILSIILDQDVYRVQSPMKWQPNEIDGYYIARNARVGRCYPSERGQKYYCSRRLGLCL